MSTNRTGWVTLGIACVALALAAYAAFRDTGSSTRAPAAAVDRQAREQIEQLRRAVAERDAVIARLASVANAPRAATAAGSASTATTAPAPPPDPGPRRYANFEIPNPAVTVTQKPDGLYDIRTTDPKLSGTIMEITATTEAGEQDRLFIRIP